MNYTDIDFNGLGSATIHKDNEILISIGTPTSSSDAISYLAQNKDSFFGKILSIKKDDTEFQKLVKRRIKETRKKLANPSQ